MLEISRPDIHGEFIVDLKPVDRFIKLPIEPYLKLLTVRDPSTGAMSTAWDQTNRPQFALINAINSPRYRFVCAALARRLGKTYISNVIAQLVMLVPECNVLIMSPNFSLSSISFEIQRKLISTFDLEIERDNLKDIYEDAQVYIDKLKDMIGDLKSTKDPSKKSNSNDEIEDLKE